MAQNFNLGELGQFVTTNVTSNTITFVANTSQLVIANNVALVANGSNGTSGQALTTNGSALYWSTIVGTNTSASYTWSNTHTFSNTVTLNGNVVIGTSASFSANGTIGTAGQVLTSNGTTVYWSTVSGGGGSVNVAAQYTWTNTQTFTNTITFSGSIVANTINATSIVLSTNTLSIGTAAYHVANGNLGLGTSSPAATLDVVGTVNTSKANTLQQTLTFNATQTWDTSLGQITTVTLTANVTFSAPSNLKVGTYILHIYQDSTGGRTATWNSIFKWPAGVAPVLTTNASAHDVLSFVSDGTNLYGSFLPNVK